MKLDDYRSAAFKYGLGTIVAQVISFVSVPLVTHFYQPADYGTFVSFTASAAILLPIVTLKIESLVSISDKLSDIQELKLVATRLSSLMSLGISLLIFLFLSFSENFNPLNSLLDCIFLGVILQIQSLCVILIQIELKQQSFIKVNISGIFQNLSTLVFQILLAIVKPSLASLQIGYACGRMVGLIPLLRKSTVYSEQHNTKEKFSLKAVGKIFGKSKHFVGVSFVEAMLTGIPILLLHKFYGQNFAGYFGLIQAIYLVPVTLVSSSFAAIAFGALAGEKDLVEEEKLRHKTQLIQSFRKPILAFALIFSVISFTLAEPIMSLVISENWRPMYVIIPFITLSSAFNFIWFPIMNFLALENKSRIVFQGALGRLIFGSISSAAAIQFHLSWSGMIQTYITSQIVFQILWLGVVKKKNS